MKTEFSEYQFRKFIYPAFPDAPRPSRKFTIDELVCTFLALHDVEVVPVGADIQMSRGEAALMGAAFGLTGPAAWDTMATGAQMKQDARIAARQEWNSWKQWALSHADWPAFKEKANSDYEKANEAAEAWKSDSVNQGRFKELVQQGLDAEMQEGRSFVQMTIIGVGLIVAGAVSLVIVDALSKPTVRQDSTLPEQKQIEQRY
jgi:hypothetical protein